MITLFPVLTPKENEHRMALCMSARSIRKAYMYFLLSVLKKQDGVSILGDSRAEKPRAAVTRNCLLRSLLTVIRLCLNRCLHFITSSPELVDV